VSAARESAVLLAAVVCATAAAQASAATIEVKMTNVAFEPARVTAKVGDTIVWTNNDIFAHTATARDKAWDLNALPKKTVSFTVKKAGTIEYYCRFHPNMVGHIEAKD
jgi:plastocyanin